MDKLINGIAQATKALDMAEKDGDMAAYDRILKRRGNLILGALKMGADENYLKQITR